MEDENSYNEERRSRNLLFLNLFLSVRVGILTGVLYVSILIALRIFG